MENARPACAADLSVLVELIAAEHTELAGQRGGDLWRATSAPPSLATITDLANDHTSLVLCGTWDDVVVGVLTARIVHADGVGAVASVRDLYVEPPARAVGVGAAMMSALREWARANECIGLDAVVLPGARETKNFFEAHGLVARAITVHHRFRAETPS